MSIGFQAFSCDLIFFLEALKMNLPKAKMNEGQTHHFTLNFFLPNGSAGAILFMAYERCIDL